jgi:RNA polymerase sigma factor (sigma-70 family)
VDRDAAGRDADAIRRCLAGDREAFAELVARHQDRVYGLGLRGCAGDRAEAADLAQECFVRAWAALGRFDPRRPFRPWLLRIAVNLCRDRARRRAARPAGPPPGDGKWAEPADPADGPQDLVVRAEERRRVRAAVAALPPDQRLLLALAYDQELPLAEIAAILGLPQTVVSSRPYRARRTIAARLQEEEHDVLPRGAPRPARVRVRRAAGGAPRPGPGPPPGVRGLRPRLRRPRPGRGHRRLRPPPRPGGPAPRSHDPDPRHAAADPVVPGRSGAARRRPGGGLARLAALGDVGAGPGGRRSAADPGGAVGLLAALRPVVEGLRPLLPAVAPAAVLAELALLLPLVRPDAR